MALTTALWDHRARAACLQRAAEAARDAGSLQLLDTTLWILSLAELSGGTPRRAGDYIEQVRELRRAIGYEAEHVVNAAYLAWIGAPRAQVEALAEAMRLSGFGGVHSSAVAALALRDLAEGHYRDAYHRLKPLIDDPFLQVTPLEYPDFVEAAVRSGPPGRRAARGRDPDRDGGGQRVGVDARAWPSGPARWSRPTPEAEPHTAQAIETLAAAGVEVDLRPGRTCSTASGCGAASGAGTRATTSGTRHGDRWSRPGRRPFAQRARTELEATGERVAVRARTATST